MLGLAASVQPAFDALWGQPGGLYEHGLGAERAAAMNPFRTMLERGIEVGRRLGLAGHAARSDARPSRRCETHHDPAQRLDRGSRRSGCTPSAARGSAHQEDKKGALAPGMHADFAAYDADPFDGRELDGSAPGPHRLARPRGLRGAEPAALRHDFPPDGG